jgi:hypothetical protein
VDTLDVSRAIAGVRDLEVRTLMLGELAEFLSARCGAPLGGMVPSLMSLGVFTITCLAVGIRPAGQPGSGCGRCPRAASCVLHGYSRLARPCWPEVP